jgi:hypothetical protein
MSRIPRISQPGDAVGEERAPAIDPGPASEIAWLLMRAAHFRCLAEEYRTAGQAAAAEKMVQVATELETKAAVLGRAAAAPAPATREAR